MAFPDLQPLLRPGMGKVWRVVETQEKAATRDITSNRQEQERLEELLELHKPARYPGTEHLSYLLASPFRYPPLEHGSRFGRESDPGVFYASLELRTAFAETAVYLWLFRRGSRAGQVLDEIRDERMSFSVRVNSLKALDLNTEPFGLNRQQLADPANWDTAQEFGIRARRDGAEAIWFASSRWPGGTNVALLSPGALASRKEAACRHWKLRLSRDSCWFGHHEGKAFEFDRVAMEATGALQHPAL